MLVIPINESEIGFRGDKVLRLKRVGAPVEVKLYLWHLRLACDGNEPHVLGFIEKALLLAVDAMQMHLGIQGICLQRHGNGH